MLHSDQARLQQAPRGSKRTWSDTEGCGVEVSSEGYIRKTDGDGRPRLLQGHDAGGYRNVYLMECDVGVGHLVAQMHVAPRPAGNDVVLRHRNLTASDNRAANLRWSTRSAGGPGVGGPTKPVYALAAPGAAYFVREFPSIYEAANYTGLACSTMRRVVQKGLCRHGLYWTHDELAGGRRTWAPAPTAPAAQCRHSRSASARKTLNMRSTISPTTCMTLPNRLLT